MQLWKLKAKMDFYLAKHGLTNMRFKDQIGLNLGKETVEKKGEEKERRRRRRGRGRKEIKQAKIKRYGTTWVLKL